jgi:hypothetical protein
MATSDQGSDTSLHREADETETKHAKDDALAERIG